tara:strand:- start:296 stop:1129 length:834 start_codon:yes stop_codon:yes gene_type:complete
MAVDLGNAFNYFNLDEDVGIPATNVAQKTLANNDLSKAVPILASEDIAARNVGVPQDNKFTGIMRNFARVPLFQAGANFGLTGGKILTGAVNPLFALAGAIGSQFLPLDRRPSDLDYQYVNDPNNMGGLRVVDNKIIDPSGILQGKNFASGFGSNSLATMYDKAISKFDERIGKLEEEEELTKAQQRRLDRLIGRRQIAKNRLEDFLAAGGNIPGTNITRNQFAYDYNRGIGQFAQPDYDALDTQSYESLGGGEQTTTVDGQDITSYSDPYDPGTDD